MTIVTIEYMQSLGGFRILADSRLSQNNQTLTDKMPKIFSLPVKVYRIGKKGKLTKIVDCSIGIAFTGSSNVAFATISILQSYLTSLSYDGHGPLPALRDISEFARKLLDENYRDFGQLWGTASSCGLLLFGSTPVDKTLGAYFLRTVILEGSPVVTLEPCDLSGNKWCFFGSGAERFAQLVEIEKEKPYSVRMGLFDVLQGFIDEGHSDVGGSIQAAIARPGTVTLPQILKPHLERSKQEAEAVFVGRKHPEFSRLAGCTFGTHAIGPTPPPEAMKELNAYKREEAAEAAGKLKRRRGRREKLRSLTQ